MEEIDKCPCINTCCDNPDTQNGYIDYSRECLKCGALCLCNT